MDEGRSTRVSFPPDSDVELCEYGVDEPASTVRRAAGIETGKKVDLRPNATSRALGKSSEVPPEELERRKMQSQRDKEAAQKAGSSGKGKFSNPFWMREKARLAMEASKGRTPRPAKGKGRGKRGRQ